MFNGIIFNKGIWVVLISYIIILSRFLKIIGKLLIFYGTSSDLDSFLIVSKIANKSKKSIFYSHN